MKKYFLTAVALKAFSLNSVTRLAYRKLGNSIGQKRREKQNIDAYVERGDLLVETARQYGLLDRDITAAELGTGWIHWFGLYFALHSRKNVKLHLFDVWDNRQLNALKSSFSGLAGRWKKNSDTDQKKLQKIANLLKVDSFEDLYDLFSASYTVNEQGSLTSYNDSTYDALFSFHVMEHIGRDSIEDCIGNMYRMLKPGGVCIHQIGIDDHLSHYDKTASPKAYLGYSLKARKRLFENVVQYHNALQAEDFIRYFRDHNFEVLSSQRETTTVEDLSIHDDWIKYSQEDLETTILTVVCKKPEEHPL